MKIAVIGGGNIGTLMAAEMAAKDHEVSILTSKPEQWSNQVSIYDDQDKLLSTSKISQITSNAESALRNAELIFVTVPAQLFPATATRVLPFIQPEQTIGIIPGSGGAEFAFAKHIQRGGALFGYQRVHSIARLRKYGHSVYMLGRKSNLQIASIPSATATKLAKLNSSLFDLPCKTLPNYLSVTLTPSNPILHTTRLYSMFKNYQSGKFYHENYLFYESWNNDSSEALLACDDELQQLCQIIPLDLSSVQSLMHYYESKTASELTKKLRSITAFKGITSPMIETDHGWIPDFTSRYFVADFAYGLKIIKDIAKLYEVSTPTLDQIWNWYAATVHPRDYFRLDLTKVEFERIYHSA